MLIVVAAALMNENGRVLFQRRPDDARHHAGLWEFPGGKVERGEAIDAALCRELHEELGIVVTPERLDPAGFSHLHEGGRELLLLLFTCRHWTGQPLAAAGHRLAWHRPADLEGLPMPPADLPLIAALRRLG